MATKTLRVFAEYTSTGFVPMPTLGNIDYGYTLGSTFPATTPTTFQTDNPDLVVTVTAMTDFYVWIRINGTAWNPSYTRNVRVYPDSPNINNVVMNMIIATGPAGIGAYTQIVQTSNRLYFNGATTDAVYDSKFAGKTYINELNFGTAPGLATVATSGAYADLTGKPSLATVATSGLFTDLSSKPSGTAPLSYNSGTNSFVITQANTSTNGFLSSTDWNTFNNKFATPAGTTLQYVDGTGALQTFPLLASADKLVINVRNSSGVSMPKGSVVYINGATGNKPTVALAQANSDASSAQTLGLLQATLANNAEGNVVIVGSVIDLNTSAFTEGQQLYLSPTTAGAYTTTKPYAPSHLVYVGVVTRSHVSLGTIEVKVQNGYEMDELHDVSAQSPSNNDGLFYNTTTSLWEKKSIATVLGYTPYNGTDTSIKALFSASAPLSYSNGVYSISQATTASNGYLSSTDWNTFNGKESVLTFSTPLVRTTNTISINQASASTSGFLSSTDWNTFNNKGSGSGSVTSVAMTVPTGLSISGTPITTSGTLALSLTAGYVIPTTSSASNWDSAYTNRITSLTLNGSSGTATLAANVLNIPSYTLVGLGGQTALNGTGFVKISGTTISYDNSTYLTTASASSTYQTIITNNITGTGTINEIAYFNTSSTVASLSVATYPSLTELAYVKGVTSAIQTQLNAKASTLSGTTNYISKFTSSSAIGNSVIYDDGTNVGIGTTIPNTLLTIAGANQATGAVFNTYGNVLIYSSDSHAQNKGGSLSLGGKYNSAGTPIATFARIHGKKENTTVDSTAGYLSFETVPEATAILTERLRITSTGLFGVGTASPDYAITIVGSTEATSGIRLKNTNGVTSNSRLIIEQANGQSMNMYSAGNGFTFNYNLTGGIAFYDGLNNASRMVINGAGNMGLGITPTATDFKLSIYGTNSRMVFQNSSTGTTDGDGFFVGNYGVNGYVYNYEAGALHFGTGASTRMYITPDGLVGVGTTEPLYRLTVRAIQSKNSTTYNAPFAIFTNDSFSANPFGVNFGIIGNASQSARRVSIQTTEFGLTNDGLLSLQESGGNVLIGTGTNGGYKLYVSGTIYATGNITANSDLTLKKNLKLIDNPIDKLMQLNGYAYQWKANDEHQYGVIAQEVEKILPYAVSTGLDGIKGVSYNQITPLLIEGFKSHESEITILKARVKYLESKLA